MKPLRHFPFLLSLILLISLGACHGMRNTTSSFSGDEGSVDFTIAFGSCNHQEKHNPFWDDILATDPDLWIWGGDNIYADTEDMQKMQSDYEKVIAQAGYRKLKEEVPILAVWDDHDYGVNDGGKNYEMKEESRHLFLDFLGVSKKDLRRRRRGIFYSEIFETKAGSVRVILLDTRYHKTALRVSDKEGRRYDPHENGEGTILGEYQWNWLERSLEENNSEFTIIVSSIQVLSDKHGFESWALFPHERARLLDLIAKQESTRVLLLSGDRHISEFSQVTVPGMDYPLLDFTSSGLTHSYTSFSGEKNPHRIGEVVKKKSFGLLKLDINEQRALLQIHGEDGEVFREIERDFRLSE